MKDKVCFSKTFTYLVLLVVAIVGFFLVVNYSNQQKLALNSRASARFGGGITATPVPVASTPVFTLTELRQRAQSVLDRLAIAKSRSATMNTTSIQGEIESVNQRLNLTNSSFTSLSQQVVNIETSLKTQLNKNTPLKNTAQTVYNSAQLRYSQTQSTFRSVGSALSLAQKDASNKKTAYDNSQIKLSQKAGALGDSKKVIILNINNFLNLLNTLPFKPTDKVINPLKDIKSRISSDTTNSFTDETAELNKLSQDISANKYVFYFDSNISLVKNFISAVGTFDKTFSEFNVANVDFKSKEASYKTAQSAFTVAQNNYNTAQTAMNQAKIVMDAKLVDLNTYKFLETTVSNFLSNITSISTNLSVDKKLPGLMAGSIGVIPPGLNGTIYQPEINNLGNYINIFNSALSSVYDAYNNLDAAIINAETNLTTQVQTYTNYCSNIKSSNPNLTYQPILGIDGLPSDVAQQYYNDYCGQNEAGYGWNGIYGNYGKKEGTKYVGAMCYTATGLCSSLSDCVKVDCISRIGNGLACINKPVTDAVGMQACADKYKVKLGIDILQKNICPQNSNTTIGWYGGRGFYTTDEGGVKTKKTGSDTCLRLNAANGGASTCNQVVANGYCNCKDAGYTYALVNGKYTNMGTNLYGRTTLYRPKRGGATGYEMCPFSLK